MVGSATRSLRCARDAVKRIVTMGKRPTHVIRARAEAVSERIGWPLVGHHDADGSVLDERTLAYVITRHREELRLGADALFVNQGMLVQKVHAGREHPIIRAVDPDATVASIFDGTLGLAADALQLAAVTGAHVVGHEASPVVWSLLEDGLPRLRTGSGAPAEAASRLDARHADTRAALAATPPDAFDVVYLDPMFPAPRPSAPGFPLLAHVAHRGDGDWASLLEPARRVARRRVVIKVPKRADVPEADQCIDGKTVRYLIFDAAARATSSSRPPADRRLPPS